MILKVFWRIKFFKMGKGLIAVAVDGKMKESVLHSKNVCLLKWNDSGSRLVSCDEVQMWHGAHPKERRTCRLEVGLWRSIGIVMYLSIEGIHSLLPF